MKKIKILTIMMLTLLSCFVFSACGNKYEKLSLDFYAEGNSISSVNLILDEDNDYQDEIVIGVKFSGVKEKNIGKVIFEFPNTIGTLSNQRQDGKFVYVTLNVHAPVENEEIYLKAIHVASGKSKSLPVVVDQKANDIELLSDTYIVSIPSNGAKEHLINADSIVKLLPAGSTDQVLFNMSGTFNNAYIETIKQGDYIEGFKVSSSLRDKVEIRGLYPVTMMRDEYSGDKFKAKTFKVVFIPTLTNGDLKVISDDVHMKSGYLYDPIHLIANDTSNATADYNYNNFYVQLQYKGSTKISEFINGYNYTEYYKVVLENSSNISMIMNEDETKAYIQAKNMNEDVKKVKIKLVPNNCVGDIDVVELSINVKADIKPGDIVVKKGNNIVEDNNVDIYDVYTGELSRQMLSFTPELTNSLSDLQNMRIQVPVAYLDAYETAGKGINVVYKNENFVEALTLTDISRIDNWRKNDKLLTIYKNNSYNVLKFYYDADLGFISETINKNDRIFIKYVANTYGDTFDRLTMNIFNYYSGNHEYLENIPCLKETILFNSKRGVEAMSYDVGVASISPTDYDPKAKNNPKSVYLDRAQSKDDSYYALHIDNVTGINKSNLAEAKFKLSLINHDNQSNLIKLESSCLTGDEYSYSSSNAGNVSTYLKVDLSGCDLGKYTLKISHDGGYKVDIDVYVYDSTVIASTTNDVKVLGNVIDNRSGTYAGYGDYIVKSGETLNIAVDHTVPSWYIKEYKYSATIEGATGVKFDNYYNLSFSQNTATLKCLNGTYIDGIKTVKLTVEVVYKEDDGSLQLIDASTVTKAIPINIFIFDELKQSDFEINKSETDVYSYDLLGTYDKLDAQLILNVSLPNNEGLWNYTQKGTQTNEEPKSDQDDYIGTDKKAVDVVWFTNSENYHKVTTLNQGDREIQLQFAGDEQYDIVVYARIKQFDTVFEHLSCTIHVRKPIVTKSLGIEFTKTQDKKQIEIKDKILNLRVGVDYFMDVDNLANSSIITNKDSLAVVVNGGGEVVTDVVRLEKLSTNQWKIYLDSPAELRDDLRLLVFAQDALKKKININSIDLVGSNIAGYLMDDYSSAYEEYYLSLSDGSIENRYWIESADDFWEIKDNNNLKDKHFVVRQNINLKNTTYETGVIDNFSGSITTYDVVKINSQAELDAGQYFEIDKINKKFVFAEAGYDNNKTYYQNKYYSIYGVELNNTSKNLFETMSGVISSIHFTVKYNYKDLVISKQETFGLIGTNSDSAELINVTASVSGSANFEKSSDVYTAYFGGLVGNNEGIIRIDDKTKVGVTGEIDINGDAKVQFGALVGRNENTIQGVIVEEGLDDNEFVAAFGDQGAISNLVINSTLNHEGSAIGGVAGYNIGKISKVFVTGRINAPYTNNVGGVVGQNLTTSQEVKITYDGSNYTGVNFGGIATDKYDLMNIKSSVIIEANDNVGGIVGLDTSGNYYYCRYQVVADVQNNGIKANNNVGGIAGSSTSGKFIFCSVYGYRWDYSQYAGAALNITTFDNKNADIYGNTNVGGIIGYAKLDYSGTAVIEADLTAIRQSSANAYIKANNIAGALVGCVENTESETSPMPVDTIYFMGKIDGATVHPMFIVATERVSQNVIYANYYYNYISNSNKVLKKQFPDYPSGEDWGNGAEPKDYTINVGKPYVLNPDKSGPIFDKAPKSVTVEAKDFSKYITINGFLVEKQLVTSIDETHIHIDYYRTEKSVLDPNYQNTQDEIDDECNVYNFVDFLNFTCEPSGKYRFKVTSSNPQVAEVLSNGQLKIKGIGVCDITFISVLNSEARCSVTIEVNYPMNTNYAISSSATDIKISDERIATNQAKQYFVHEFNSDFEYRTNTELGYQVKIEVAVGYTIEGSIIDYIKVSNKEYTDNMFIAPGGRLSFELIKSVDTEFKIIVTPYVYIGDKNQEEVFGSQLTFNLSTKQGVSKIKLNYEKVVLYPNDEIYVTAIFTTDKELGETNVRDIASDNSDYINVQYVEGSLKTLNIVEGNATGTQTARYKISVLDEAKHINEQESVSLSININEVNTTARFELFAQRIDNIDIKNYATSRDDKGTPDNIADDTYEVESLSRILRPNYNGLLVLDVVPSNGQFDHLEITDVTGEEEILFTQINCGASVSEGDIITGEGLETERIEKGIILNGKTPRYYVMTRISADNTSRIHTIKVTARSEEGLDLGTTYHYIDVKMMPSVTMRYYDPNGIETAVSKDVDDKDQDLNLNKLYLANGVSSVDFYITTANSDGNIDITLSLSDNTYNVDECFEMVKGQKDHYELNFKKYIPGLKGKVLSITAQTRATMDNGTVEYESTTFKFIITDFVIHNISVNNSRRLDYGYNYELYGDYSVPVELSFYFDKTDISYYNNGNPFDQIYEYNSEHYQLNVDQTTVTGSIYSVIKEINANPEKVMWLSDYSNSKIELATVPGGLFSAKIGDKIILTRNDTTDSTTLTVTRDNSNSGVIEKSNMVVEFKYDYAENRFVDSGENLKLSRKYSFNFSDRTSLLKMTSINNEEEFLNMKSSDTGYYILTRDLELGKRGTSTYEKYGAYSPIDVDIAMFDGNGYTIRIYSFAEFAEETIHAGLFKQIEKDMIVMNLNVEYISQNDGAGNWSFGRVTGSTISYSDICTIDDELAVDYKSVLFGGISPTNNGIVTNCKVSGRIAMHASTLENSMNDTKEIKFDIGGLVGNNSGYITNSVSELQIYALANIGGLVYANNAGGKVVSSYFDAQEGKGLIYAYPDVNTDATNAIETRVSGFVVDNFGEISMSYTSIGYNATLNKIGAMTVKDSSAGFVYSNSGEIKDCYVTQIILGKSNNTFYGFVYKNSGKIKTSFTYINNGGWSDKLRLFAPSGTVGLTDCIEFINTNQGYTIKSDGLYRENVGVCNIKTTYTQHNFNFGDNENSIWTISGSSMPRLVATNEKATGNRLVENKTYTKETENGETINVTETTVHENGYGTKQNPYIIYDLISWETYMKPDKNAGYKEIRSYYRIVADIDFSSITKNLPTTEMIFSGNIQGNNMKISGFTIYSEEALPAIGLFKEISYTGAKEISPAIRNLSVNAYSVLAVKTEIVGVLAGRIEDYHLYNISVSCDDTVLGGNAVGGFAGIICGDFDIEDLSSSVSVNATKHTVGGVYDMYVSKVNGGQKYQNINKVNFAGAVAGIIDAFDNTTRFKLTERDINESYYKNIRQVSVEGAITAIGENVGGIFGFLGERVKLTDARININGGKITARRYAGMAVAENRGVMKNVICSTEDEDLFKDSNYVVGGAVGLNFGGYIDSVETSVDIVKMTADNTVGGIVGRNVGGTLNNATYNGKLFANIMGGIIGVENNISTLKYSDTISSESKELAFNGFEEDDTDPTDMKIKDVVYKENANLVDNYQNCSISIESFNYWLENMAKIYRYTIDTDSNLQTRAIRCLGLFVGRSNNTLLSGIKINTIKNLGIDTTITLLTFDNAGTMAKDVVLGEYVVDDDELWKRTIVNARLSASVNYTFIKNTIPTFDISGVSADNVKNSEIYLMAIVGRQEDSFDSWDGEIADINNHVYQGRILFLNPNIIKEEKIGDLDPDAAAPSPGTEPDSSEGTEFVEPDEIEKDPPAGGGVDVEVDIVGSELFNPEYENIANGTNTTYKFESIQDLIGWIDFIGYNRIKDEIWVSVDSSLGISGNSDLDKYVDMKTVAGYNYKRGVSSGKICVAVAYDFGNENVYTKPSLPTATEFRTFAVDSYANSVTDVSTSDQLTYIFEQNAHKEGSTNKNKPVCVPNSMADQVYKNAKNVLSLICTDLDTDYIKAKKIYEWICINVTYDNATLNKMTSSTPFEKYRAFFAEGALIDRYAVCDGMAKAYVIMCGIEGIPCIQIDGFPTGSRKGHAWNQVKLGSNWYDVDPTNNRFGWKHSLAEVLDSKTYHITDINKQNAISVLDIFSMNQYNYATEDVLISSNTNDDIYEEMIDLLEAFEISMGALKYGYIEFKDENNSAQLLWNPDAANTDKNNIYYCFVMAFSGKSFTISGERAYDVNGNLTVWMFEIVLS